MSATVKPQWEYSTINRDQDGIASIELRYNIIGTSSAEEADAALLEAADAPFVYGETELIRNTTSVARTSQTSYEGIVTYTRIEQEQEEDGSGNTYTFSFDSTGGTQHVTQSYETVGGYAPGGRTAPNHNGAIGVSDNDVTGCDILVPQLVITASKTMKGYLPPEYVLFLANVTGKINADSFMGFAPGEVLFEGAATTQNFSRYGATSFELSLKFRVSPNAGNINVGNIVIPFKRGWDYLWVQYQEKEDTQANKMIKIPIAAYVECVYASMSFSGLYI